MGSGRKERSAVLLRADDGFGLPEMPGTPVDERNFTATYYDTPQRRLERAGITLRRRMENGKSVWELDLPREPEHRTLEAAGGPAGPPPVLGKLLTGLVQGGSLGQVRTVRTRRAGVRVSGKGSNTAEVLIDATAILNGRRVDRKFTEISVRPLDGDTRLVRALAKGLLRAGAERVRARARDNGSNGSGIAAFKEMLARDYARMLAHDPGVRLGDDPEDVHQLRVATRRLRALLRAARPYFEDDGPEALRSELAWLANLLGSVRDLDVLIERVRDERTVLDFAEQTGVGNVIDLLVAEREAARSRLLSAMRTKRYLRLLARVEEIAEQPPTGGENVPVEKMARSEFKKLRTAASSLGPEPHDEELHRIRVRVKRARYAAELAEGATGKRASRFIAKAKRLQDVAGDLQDAAVAEERLRVLVEQIEQRGAAFAAGRLVERALTRRAQARAAFPEAWSQVEKAGSRAWN